MSSERTAPWWIPFARHRPSPNFDQRPAGETVDLLVIHNISLPPGKYGGPWIEDFFLNRLDTSHHPFFTEIANLRVSAHLLIRRNGEILQFVPLNLRAWHAGVSSFSGREQCNDFSIGIELEGSDDQPFADAQYTSLKQATQYIRKLYPAINQHRIKGHNDVAPGRKTDPGPYFDWRRYLDALEN